MIEPNRVRISIYPYLAFVVDLRILGLPLYGEPAYTQVATDAGAINRDGSRAASSLRHVINDDCLPLPRSLQGDVLGYANLRKPGKRPGGHRDRVSILRLYVVNELNVYC